MGAVCGRAQWYFWLLVCILRGRELYSALDVGWHLLGARYGASARGSTRQGHCPADAFSRDLGGGRGTKR